MNDRECFLKSCSKNPRIMQQRFQKSCSKIRGFQMELPGIICNTSVSVRLPLHRPVLLLWQNLHRLLCFSLIVSGSYPSIRYAAAAFGSKEIAFSNASIASLCCPTRRCTEPFFHPHGYILRSHFYCFINVV